MSIQSKPIKYAFTSRALIECIKLYGEKIFTIAERIYVVENALITSPQIKSTPVKNIHYSDGIHNEEVAYLIYKHWFNLSSPPPFGHNEWKEELLILGKFAQTDPDNIKIVFYNLSELSYLNRIYSNDELLCVSDVEAYLK